MPPQDFVHRPQLDVRELGKIRIIRLKVFSWCLSVYYPEPSVDFLAMLRKLGARWTQAKAIGVQVRLQKPVALLACGEMTTRGKALGRKVAQWRFRDPSLGVKPHILVERCFAFVPSRTNERLVSVSEG
jgi:hypothetical protein